MVLECQSHPGSRLGA
ncbi:hypothetical protein MTR67_039515 [Solanum verrucosum]|uniref:Uncharacterized protein n=1 Tax=Solanum verrucosum TaxID=315347 RepID=A0AAF0ZQS1_SOLVR|nr:hypothetical protein MTR67_039515 [Solanum verrucosum]